MKKENNAVRDRAAARQKRGCKGKFPCGVIFHKNAIQTKGIYGIILICSVTGQVLCLLQAAECSEGMDSIV